MSNRTPLFENHVALGARMVDFAGWEMPVQYNGILDEHRAVRETAGAFDISHMGEFFVSGSGATAWLDGLLTNRVEKLAVGEAQYTLMLNERGGVIDDLIVYRTGDEDYLLIVNAAKIDEDAAWLQSHAKESVSFVNRSGDFCAVAVQGPVARGVFQTVFGEALPTERNRVIKIQHAGADGFAVTTGYTGEDGFEVVVPNVAAPALWDALIAAGAKPCGLGARDTLRLEMCYPLNGSDLSPDRTPLEAGLGFFVDLTKENFVGREALVAQKSEGLPVRLVAIAITEKSPPIRPHYAVWANGEPVSETCSGALSPTLGYGIAMAYLPPSLAKVGQELEIEVRGKRYKASVVKKPFLNKN
jgi:aminomethyltransferase